MLDLRKTMRLNGRYTAKRIRCDDVVEEDEGNEGGDYDF